MDNAEILVTVSEVGIEPSRLEELSSTLREELLSLEVDDVQPVSAGPAPAGTRGLDVAAIGTLLVTLQSAATLVDKVVGAVRNWLAPGPAGRTVELTIGDKSLKLVAASEQDQRRLIEEFVQSVRAASPPA